MLRSHSQHTSLWLWMRETPAIAQSLMILCAHGESPGREWGGRQEGEGTHHHLDWFIGEFGSVREAQLKQEDGSFMKVAVKMLKGEWRVVDVA